jgi:two-component system sensor histidine kinase BaeS
LNHNPEGGQVTVQLESQAEGVAVRVRDTSSGILDEHLPFIFNRFYVADQDRFWGMGFGLVIAKEFVEAHHGNIHVKSVCRQGTTFTVYLQSNAAASHV